MEESYDEGLANHIGPESCGDNGNIISEALAGEGPHLTLPASGVGSTTCPRLVFVSVYNYTHRVHIQGT